MSRPQTTYDRFPGFLAAATADTVATRLAAIDGALAAGIGHKLFTVLVLNWAKGENQRYYSNQPAAYPVGGAKPITKSSASAVLEGQCRFLNDYEDVRGAFFDHELIRSLGCESCVNVPVRWNGKTIGMLNLLHEAGWYTPDDVPALTVFAALAAPALLEIIAGWDTGAAR
jgi:hypothetical protein